jgi:hypothetical protein
MYCGAPAKTYPAYGSLYLQFLTKWGSKPNMKPSLQKSMCLAIGAAALLAFAAPFTAHAAGEIHYYDSYVNKEKGIELYLASQLDGSSFQNAVISRQPDES